MVRWVQSHPGPVACVQTLRLPLCVCFCATGFPSALRSSVEGAFYARNITASFVQYPRFWNSKPLWPHLVSLCLQWLPRIKAESAETATDSLAHKWRSNLSFPQWCPCEDAMLKMRTAEKPLNSRLFLKSLWTWVSNEVFKIMIFTPFFLSQLSPQENNTRNF